METYVDLSVSTGIMDLTELEALVSDIRILSQKEIKHHEQSMRILGNPEVDERKIYAEFHGVSKKGVLYLVEDYVKRRDGSGMTLVGREEYSSTDLRIKSRKV